MNKIDLSSIHFEWKQQDEVILHYAHPSKIQTYIEILYVIIPMLISWWIIIALLFNKILPLIVWIILFVVFTTIAWLAIWYKLYRANNNYVIITSKRILFHWIEWLFKDYVKKINYNNVRNVNYFTQSLIGRIFKYWMLEIQSSHWWEGDITVYHIRNGKLLTHYIDKLIHLTSHERDNFSPFDPEYFKNWNKK
jgi:hypothetical protein